MAASFISTSLSSFNRVQEAWTSRVRHSKWPNNTWKFSVVSNRTISGNSRQCWFSTSPRFSSARTSFSGRWTSSRGETRRFAVFRGLIITISARRYQTSYRKWRPSWRTSLTNRTIAGRPQNTTTTNSKRTTFWNDFPTMIWHHTLIILIDKIIGVSLPGDSYCLFKWWSPSPKVASCANLPNDWPDTQPTNEATVRKIGCFKLPTIVITPINTFLLPIIFQSRSSLGSFRAARIVEKSQNPYRLK